MNQQISISLDAFSDQTRSAILSIISTSAILASEHVDLDNDDDIKEIKNLLAEIEDLNY